jgi:RNA polymerase sigma factor (sigma-70 family)
MTLLESKKKASVAVSPENVSRAPEIARLYREHNRALVLYLAARLKDIQLAHEVAQESYVRLLQLDVLGTVSFLRAYLFKVAGNLAIDRIRQRQTRARGEILDQVDQLLTGPSVEHTLMARDELAHLGQLLAELPEKYQEGFRAHLIEELPFAEIAQRLGVKERMARRYITNTLLYLRLRREGCSRDEAWQRVHTHEPNCLHA